MITQNLARLLLLCVTTAFVTSCAKNSSETQKNHELNIWFRQPAKIWEERLPLGNGRLGAMPDGGVSRENITLNDITMWSGSPQEADSPEAGKFLPQIQKLLQEGKNDEAQQLMYNSFVCAGAGSGYGNGADVPYGSYQVLGELHLDYQYTNDSSVSNYERALDLKTATASTRFTKNGVKYQRSYLTNFDNDMIMIRLTADQPEQLSLDISIDRQERFRTSVNDNMLVMVGQLNNGTDGKGMRYQATIKAQLKNGQLSTTNDQLQIRNADEVILYIAAGTDFKNPEFEEQINDKLALADKTDFTTSVEKHIEKYQSLFDRSHLKIATATDKNEIPTDQRLADLVSSQSDPQLAALYYQFGRYLTISSTRPGLLPPNLQGLWANTIRTPWNGDYHLNINIQMNHWPLNVSNLAMLNEPYLELVKNMTPSGEKTAKTYYNGEGWVAHVINNVWGYTSPGEHPSWGSFNTGSAWLCQMLWTNYEFTLDTAYLETIYPIIKGSAAFYNSTLIKDQKSGYLVTSPSNSPENAFYLPNGNQANVCQAPTIDNQIIRALFGYVIEASQTLNVDQEFAETLKTKSEQLPPTQIGADSTIMEWMYDYKETDPHHRHISHLWGLYPGNEISLSNTPELATAAAKTIESRGGGGTGWSLAWKANFYARLQEGDLAEKILYRLFRPTENQGTDMQNGGGTYPNLFCAHPPFQIDGNYGGAAAVAEMLIQSQEDYIELLPALPTAWNEGQYEGLCARGGAVVDCAWSNNQPKTVTISATVSNSFRIKTPDGATKISLVAKGKTSDLPLETLITIDLKKGESIKLEFEY